LAHLGVGLTDLETAQNLEFFKEEFQMAAKKKPAKKKVAKKKK
jgi:hypothetical protein